MSRGTGSGLARVTIASPRRRVDVALPESVPVAELLPELLRHAGEDLADVGQRHGGWRLRKSDGTPIESGRTLSAQNLADGEVLHLVPGQDEWPEADYDDVVDAIATGARKQSRSWGSAATRRAGLAAAALLLLIALGVVLAAGAPWLPVGSVALAVAVALLGLGVALARALGDTGAGALLGGLALPFAFVGGLVILNGGDPLGGAGPPQYLVAFGALILAGLVGFIGIADLTQYFVGGITVGLLGLAGALVGLGSSITAADVGAILVGVVTVFTPAFPLLSIRLGKLPMPPLPTSAEELLADPPLAPRSRVYATVRRSDEILTGLLMGSAVVVAVASLLLTAKGDTGAVILVAVVSVGLLLRGRLFPSLRHRVPLLLAGVIGAAALLAGAALRLGPQAGVLMLVVFAVLVLAVALYYRDRRPTPYLGRIADILDVLLLLAVVPLVCLVIGLFGYFRGLYG